MRENLPELFCPKSVAVVGASRNSQKLGSIVLKNIVDSGFRGRIFPINLKAKEIQKIRAYPSVKDIGEVPELVIIAIPPNPAVEVIKQVADVGVKNFVVLTAGFKEIGEEGANLEKELNLIAKKKKLNILGPNCLGFVNNLCPINATFSVGVSNTGNLRFISQSGAIASSIFDWSESLDLGFNEFVTLGNKTDMNECDVLEYFYNRDESSLFVDNAIGLSSMSPIGMYLESISDGERFLDVARKITVTNPLFVLKPGKTKAAAKAMQSHTGSIAGEDVVFDSLIKQVGMTRCDSLEEFLDFAKAFAWEDAPRGPNVVVVSNAGGPAVISSDSIVENGLDLLKIPDELKSNLRKVLPTSASVSNPIDVLGDALSQRYKDTLELILSEETVGAVLVLLTPQIMTEADETAKIIGELGKKFHKPIYCSFIGARAVSQAENILDKYKIPAFEYPERAIKAIGASYKWYSWKESQKNHVSDVANDTLASESAIRIIKDAINNDQDTLDNIQAETVLREMRINTPQSAHVKSIDDAKRFANSINGPVVLKMSASGLLHKRKLGGVKTNIYGESSLVNAWESIQDGIKNLDDSIKNNVKIQIQEQVESGIEAILGFKHDTSFGKILLFGAGGSYAELIEDINILKLPVTKDNVIEMVKRSKVSKLLSANYPLEKLYELVYSFTKLPYVCTDIVEAEINPVIINNSDVWAVDGKVLLKMSESNKSADVKSTPAQTPRVPKWGEAKLVSRENLASKFNFYNFEATEELEFDPGQYVNVKVDDTNMRCYSIACHEGLNKFSLLVDTRPGGPGSQFFEKIQPGDLMRYIAPLGMFTLQENDGSESIIMAATGSGITAIRCMIEAALQEKDFKIPIKLYFGLTHNYELFWVDLFESLKQQYPNFDYEYALCEPEEEWQGHKGYITEIIERDYPDTSKSSVYICGHPAMIDAVIAVVEKNGMPKERIYLERFV